MNVWLTKGIFWAVVWMMFTLAWTLVNPIFGAIANRRYWIVFLYVWYASGKLSQIWRVDIEK